MINKAILIGNLGADPELRTAGPNPVCEFRIATSERWKDKSGEQQERTEWHRIIVWGKSGENCARYLSKGSKVYVEGRIQTREWAGTDGAKRFTTEIVANTVQFLDSKRDGGDGRRGGGPPPPSGYDGPPPSDGGAFSDDEIPF